MDLEQRVSTLKTIVLHAFLGGSRHEDHQGKISFRPPKSTEARRELALAIKHEVLAWLRGVHKEDGKAHLAIEATIGTDADEWKRLFEDDQVIDVTDSDTLSRVLVHRYTRFAMGCWAPVATEQQSWAKEMGVGFRPAPEAIARGQLRLFLVERKERQSHGTTSGGPYGAPALQSLCWTARSGAIGRHIAEIGDLIKPGDTVVEVALLPGQFMTAGPRP